MVSIPIYNFGKPTLVRIRFTTGNGIAYNLNLGKPYDFCRSVLRKPVPTFRTGAREDVVAQSYPKTGSHFSGLRAAARYRVWVTAADDVIDWTARNEDLAKAILSVIRRESQTSLRALGES
jgi:hypothetical protein